MDTPGGELTQLARIADALEQLAGAAQAAVELAIHIHVEPPHEHPPELRRQPDPFSSDDQFPSAPV